MTRIPGQKSPLVYTRSEGAMKAIVVPNTEVSLETAAADFAARLGVKTGPLRIFMDSTELASRLAKSPPDPRVLPLVGYKYDSSQKIITRFRETHQRLWELDRLMLIDAKAATVEDTDPYARVCRPLPPDRLAWGQLKRDPGSPYGLKASQGSFDLDAGRELLPFAQRDSHPYAIRVGITLMAVGPNDSEDSIVQRVRRFGKAYHSLRVYSLGRIDQLPPLELADGFA